MAGVSESQNHWRYHEPHAHLSAPFGSGGFGAVAEKLARVFGTPQYLISQTVVVIAWIIANGVLLLARFDPYPFILLNLMLSFQAAYAAPFIMMSQNRQAAKDRLQAELDLQTDLKAETLIEALHGNVETLRLQQWQELLQIQQNQIDLLQGLLGRLDGPQATR